MAYSKVTDQELVEMRDRLLNNPSTRLPIRAWTIKNLVKIEKNIELDESTIRGRFVAMGMPLSGTSIAVALNKGPGLVLNQEGNGVELAPESPVTEPEPEPEITPPKHGVKKPTYSVSLELTGYIPKDSEFEGYVERLTDKRLEVAYLTGKHPLSQGKQGTGKTMGHAYFAYRNKLPFFLVSCFPDMKLSKLFGDKTIINGSVSFQEGILVKMIQSPSVILFDEINYITNANSVDFHALLQNKELFVKDADNGNGKVYKLHPHCYIGFAQNPRGVKYVGPNIKPASFVGRCTYVTYPDFTKEEVKQILMTRYNKNHPTPMPEKAIDMFIHFYFACLEAIDNSDIPVDFSIRQLNNVIDLFMGGLSLMHAIDDGMISMLEAVSQPKAKESFWRLAQATWSGLVDHEDKPKQEGESK